jgi:hypothetical protein
MALKVFNILTLFILLGEKLQQIKTKRVKKLKATWTRGND